MRIQGHGYLNILCRCIFRRSAADQTKGARVHGFLLDQHYLWEHNSAGTRLCVRILVRSKTATSLSFHVYSCICPDYSRPQISVARTCTLVRLCVISLHVRVRGCRLVRCTPKVTNSTTCNVQPATDIRVRSREWRGVPRRLTSGVNKSGFRRALGCRKRLAAQLPTCSDALGTLGSRARPSSAVHSCSEFRVVCTGRCGRIARSPQVREHCPMQNCTNRFYP